MARALAIAVTLGAAGVLCTASWAAPAPDPDRALLDGVDVAVAPISHRLRPDLVARIVLGRAPNGARLDSIRLTRQGSWQVRVHGPFEVRLPNLADTMVEQACYEVADRNGRIWAFGIPECVTT